MDVLITLNINSSKLYYNKTSVKLTMHECKMLALLIKSAHGSIDYNLLVNTIWAERGAGVTLNAVSQLAYRLREKMKMIEAPVIIKISMCNSCYIKFNKKIIFIIKGRTFLRYKLKAFL